MSHDGARDERALVVVARGQTGLLLALQEFAAELGWLDVIEDRRDGASLLPRAERGGRPASGP